MTAIDRFEFERAVMDSDLKPGQRHVLHVFATRMDRRTGQVPDKYSPSLSRLAQLTGLDASTVKRHLNELEAAGWVTRNRPTAEEQRRGDKTLYQFHCPTQPRRTTPLGPGDEAATGRRTTRPAVGAQCTEPRRTVHLNTHRDIPVNQTADRNLIAEQVAAGLAQNPGMDMSTDHANKVVDEVLDRCPSHVREPIPYVLKAVRQDPARYGPTSTPPPIGQLCPAHAQPVRRDGLCSGCIADRWVGELVPARGATP